MTAGPTIDYEALTQDALRGVVRAVLSRAAKSGLPGEHHFYISFHTQAPGVTLSKRLREKYPREMTIVLQHRFWDLTVTDERFDVKLTFDGIPERIIVPFSAIKVFFDPSVRYGVQFEDGDADDASEFGSPLNYDREPSASDGDFDGGERPAPRSDAGRSAPPRRPRVMRKARHDKGQDAPITPLPTIAGNSDVAIRKDGPATKERIGRNESANASPPPPAEFPLQPDRGAEIVRLDLFRKK